MMNRVENIIKEEVLGFIGEVSKNRSFFIETTPAWENMLKRVKTENNIDKVSIVGKDNDISLQAERKNHKPLSFGKLNRQHLRNDQYQKNIIDHILKHAPKVNNYFQPKDKRIRKLPNTAPIEKKIEMLILVGEMAWDKYIERPHSEMLVQSIYEKYGDYWTELYEEIKDTPEWEVYRQEHNIARDINFGDMLA